MSFFKRIFGKFTKAERYVQSSVIEGNNSLATPDTNSGNALPFRMFIEDRFFLTKENHPCVVTGTVESGTLQLGDKVVIVNKSNMHIEAEVVAIEEYRKMIAEASVGQYVGISIRCPTLDKTTFYGYVTHGDILYELGSEPEMKSPHEATPTIAVNAPAVSDRHSVADAEHPVKDSALMRKRLWALKEFHGVGEAVNCSPNCSRVGVVLSLGDYEKGFDAEYAVVDGRAYPKARKITPNARAPVVQFSDDGKLWGYSAADKDGNEFVVINGTESQHYDKLVHPFSGFDLSFSDTGGHYAFGARRKDVAFYIIDGHESGTAKEVDNFRWTKDGSRYLFTEKIDNLKRVVVNEFAGNFYADVSLPRFSEDGSAFTYEAHLGNQVVPVVNHVEVGEACEAIENLTSGPSTFGVCYWARNGELAELCIAGKPSGVRLSVTEDDYSSYNWQIEFSPDGQHIAAAGTSQYGDHTIFQDNRSLGQFGYIERLVYDSDNRLLFLAGPTHKECYLYIDGKRESGNCGFAQFLHVAPMAGGYCFQSNCEDHSSLVLGGHRSGLVYQGNADFRLLKFSPKGQHISYVAERSVRETQRPQDYLIVDEVEWGPFDKVIGTFFIAENLLAAIVLDDGVIERLEWGLRGYR